MKKQVLIGLLVMGSWISGCGGDNSITELSNQERSLQLTDSRLVKWHQNNENNTFSENGIAAHLSRDAQKNVNAMLIFTKSDSSDSELGFASLLKDEDGFEDGKYQYKIEQLNGANYYNENQHPKLAVHISIKNLLQIFPAESLDSLKQTSLKDLAEKLNNSVEFFFNGKDKLSIELVGDLNSDNCWVVVDALHPGEYGGWAKENASASADSIVDELAIAEGQ
ncbi:Glycosyltransferase family 15 protein [Mycoavidus cysteinexigens]|uniref:Glycosyltransferase family 15 protein n=1 Tax=Mycoavidus cysteinexigens TaxID=1553431 RepID=A0A2Z6EUD2_9BURK|nr:hypothetical protein [Mycoavidus cysteinexigens]BBE09032.1 Glycosyltransferase family 15 protein [Mycoavidus cysteinexigens]GLR00301.1 hypothetical protein GCM10007934_01120 [Mycoavidus cysteinexigens]